MHLNPQIIVYLVVGVLVLGLFAFRISRMTQTRKLRVGTLAIAPVYLAAVSAFLIYRFPIAGMDWLWMAVILVVGAGIGWWRGKTMHISVDPETQALMMKASPMALIFLVGLIVVRVGLRFLFAEEAGAWHVSANLLNDAFVAFALGVLGTTSLEMYIRARRLLEEAKSGGQIAA